MRSSCSSLYEIPILFFVWEDRGGYRPDAGGIQDESMGGEGTDTDTRPGGDEWPGW